MLYLWKPYRMAHWLGMLCLLAACSPAEDNKATRQAAPHPMQVTEVYVQELQAPDANEELDSVATRFGVLAIGRSDPNATLDTLLLDGKPVFQQEDMYLSLHYYFRRNEGDIVLFSSNCGGTGCQYDDFYYLLLSPNHAPKTVTAENFRTYRENLAPKVEGGNIILDLGYQDGKQKIATLAGETVSIALQVVPKSFIGEQDCRWLYDEALKSCRSLHGTDGCKNPEEAMPAYLTRGISIIGEHPGFAAEAFTRRCQLACTTDSVVDYPTFAKEVCSQ